MQIWRNTAAVRAIVMQLVQRCKLGSEPRLTSEAALFAALDTHHYMTPIDGLYPVMPSSPDLDPMWSREPTFAISIDDTPDDPERKGTTPVSATRSSRTSIDAVPPAGRCSRSITTPPTRRTKPPSAAPTTRAARLR